MIRQGDADKAETDIVFVLTAEMAVSGIPMTGSKVGGEIDDTMADCDGISEGETGGVPSHLFIE